MNRKTPFSCLSHRSRLARRGVVVAAILACVAVQLPAAGVPTTCEFFVPERPYWMEWTPWGIVPGDFDNDADLDLVGLTSTGPQTLFNHGNGIFEVGPVPSGLVIPQNAIAADFDGDGDLDLAAADGGSTSSLKIFLNNGRGDFASPASYTVGDAYVAIAAGDMDGDGDIDVVLKGSIFSSRVSVLLNAGDGSFTLGYSVPIGEGLTGLLLGDLDGDKDLDAVVGFSDASSTATLHVFFNRSDATFDDPVGLWESDHQDSVALGDLDGDGDLDLVVTPGASTLSVLKNQGNGTFAPPQEYSTGASLGDFTLMLGDFDGDSHVDIFACGIWSPYDALLRNQGDGTFHPAELIGPDRSGPVYYPKVSGDLDGDGDLDIAFPSGNEIKVRFNFGDGRFHPGWSGYSIPLGEALYPRRIVTGEFTGDGLVDFTGFGVPSSSFGISVNRGNAVIEPAGSYPTNGTVRDILGVDLNHDSFDDVALLKANPRGVSVWLNKKDGTFVQGPDTSLPILNSSYYPNFYSGDFNGDSVLDLAVADPSSTSILILLNTGEGAFTPSHFPTTRGVGVYHLFPCDLDGDGDLDLAASAFPSQALLIFLNQGNGTFLQTEDYVFPGESMGLSGGDFDGDGDIDLVMAVPGRSPVLVFLNRGDATFDAPEAYSQGIAYGFYSDNIFASDLDLDGDLDLVRTPFTSSPPEGAILLNRGDGRFEFFGQYTLPDPDSRPAIGDVDGDGDPDFITPGLNVLWNLHSTNCTFAPFSGFMMR